MDSTFRAKFDRLVTSGVSPNEAAAEVLLEMEWQAPPASELTSTPRDMGQLRDMLVDMSEMARMDFAEKHKMSAMQVSILIRHLVPGKSCDEVYYYSPSLLPQHIANHLCFVCPPYR